MIHIQFPVYNFQKTYLCFLEMIFIKLTIIFVIFVLINKTFRCLSESKNRVS